MPAGRGLAAGDRVGYLPAMSVHWMMLFAAGVFEIAFAVCLKLSDGLRKPGWTALFVLAAAASLALLDRAIAVIPLGTAYAVWTGIGAAGTAAVGMLLFGESRSPTRLALIVVLILAIAGLKLVSTG
jgi:quaternary ammonium compound-resistance protein SugE